MKKFQVKCYSGKHLLIERLNNYRIYKIDSTSSVLGEGGKRYMPPLRGSLGYDVDPVIDMSPLRGYLSD